MFVLAAVAMASAAAMAMAVVALIDLKIQLSIIPPCPNVLQILIGLKLKPLF